MGIKVYAYPRNIRKNNTYSNNKGGKNEKMKFRHFQCKEPMLTMDTDKWIYPWKEYVSVATFRESYLDDEFTTDTHHVPFFLSLHLHITIEHNLARLWRLFFNQFPFKTLLFVNDVICGIICACTMREILQFWNARTKDGFIDENILNAGCP
jgi:hypothetical protein